MRAPAASPAQAIALAAEHYNEPDPVNIGSGQEITIRELVELICDLCSFKGELRWDTSKPDGQPRRCLDTSRAHKEFGFTAKTQFRDGLIETIQWYRADRGDTNRHRPVMLPGRPAVRSVARTAIV